MKTWKNKKFSIVILLIALTVLNGCETVTPGTENQVINEYMLTTAGFGKLEVNAQTPSRQALWDASMPGKFVTYYLDGKKYYVYADRISHAIYIGDEAAYQRFASKTTDKRLCQSMDAPTGSSAFWSCYQEFQKAPK